MVRTATSFKIILLKKIKFIDKFTFYVLPREGVGVLIPLLRKEFLPFWNDGKERD
jgi:hypothetical protein